MNDAQRRGPVLVAVILNMRNGGISLVAAG